MRAWCNRWRWCQPKFRGEGLSEIHYPATDDYSTASHAHHGWPMVPWVLTIVQSSIILFPYRVTVLHCSMPIFDWLLRWYLAFPAGHAASVLYPTSVNIASLLHRSLSRTC
ncbi:hypothetical protein F5884DRAFT_243607 [Xylogone sp. PMI_703]|nr:hypothetical protein F5884DRAFT_243607 [Xylogone sp. PMI_703]